MPKEKDRRNIPQQGERPFIQALGESWPREYIYVVRKSAELGVASRTVFLIVAVLFVASAISALRLFYGEHRGYSFNVLSSIASLVLSVVAAWLGYRSARIAARVERSLSNEVSEPERLRAHETESLIPMRALEVFGDSERAIQWMRESNPALENEAPIRVIQTEDGRQEVVKILGRIQHGVIS